MDVHTVTIEGETARGKNRVREHGATFEVLKGSRHNKLLLRCLCNNGHAGLKGQWLGWFELDEIKVLSEKI